MMKQSTPTIGIGQSSTKVSPNWLGDPPRQPLSRASRQIVAIAARISGAGAEMVGWMRHHHHQLAVGRRRLLLRGCRGHPRSSGRGDSDRQNPPEPADFHGVCPSIGSAIATSAVPRSRASAAVRSAAGICST